MEIIKKDREEIQELARKSMRENNCTGLYILSPRAGKTKIILDLIRKVPNSIIYILVPRIDVKNSWYEDMKKFNFPENHKAQVLCFASITKVPLNADLIIVDECHMLSFNDHFKIRNKSPKRLLCLTGTANSTTRHNLKSILKIDLKHEYDVEEAISDNIVSDFKILVLNVHLNDKSVLYKTEEGQEVSEKEAYDKINEEIKFVDRQIEECISKGKRNFLFSLRMKRKNLERGRAEFIFYCDSKIQVAKKIISETKNIRKLVFCSRNEIADMLCKYSYHTGNMKKDYLKKFKENKRLKELGVVNKVAVGVTISNLKFILFQHLFSNSEMSIQKLMRACNFEKNKIAKIIILCVKNTKDENWIKSALSEVDKYHITYKDYDKSVNIKNLIETM